MFEKKIYIKSEKSNSHKHYEFVRFLLVIIIFIFTVNTFANIFIYSSITKGSLFVSPLANDIIRRTVSFINSQENSERIGKLVDQVLDKDKDNFAVVIKNTQTGERYYLNESKIFDTASLYKLWVMAVAFKQLDQGEFKDTDILSDNIENLNVKFNIATDSAQLTDGSITLTVKKALERMITVSDNYSAMLLTQKVGLSNVSQFLKENDFNDSRVGTATDNPSTSARDIASFFDKLIHDKLNNDSVSQKMLDLLRAQQLNGKIPKYINQQIIIAHKTGELGMVSHDAGIIYGPKSNIIIVILSSTNNPASANEKISQISKKVFDYFYY